MHVAPQMPPKFRDLGPPLSINICNCLQLQENIPEKRNIEVEEEYITQIVGKGRKNLMRIETDSDTKIKILSDQSADGRSESVILDS